MTMTDTTATTATRISRRAGIIDTDVHLSDPNGKAIHERLPKQYRELGFGGVGALGGHRGSGNPFGVQRRDVDWGEDEPVVILRRELLDKYDMTLAIVNSAGAYGLGVHPNARYAAAAVRAHNEWLVETWAGRDPRIRLSISAAAQDPESAAAEIRRWADHPEVVQVTMTSATRTPLGDRFYWPIYQAACDTGLPVAVHPGNEGTGLANTFSAGMPASYLEWHTNLSQNYMAQICSLAVRGALVEYPDLRFVGLEGGYGWLPHLMWRLDKNWKALRVTAPWLKRAPSEYIIEQVRLSTQPMEEPPNHEHLLQILEMMHADRMLMFSSDFPHWDNDCPVNVFRRIPEPLKSRILCETAAELYGFTLED
jgi:predicted TIM-barrel fold metal-dependent hydrolase